ncbi:uncharacterized protein LOC109817620 [Cajanus cajan]|uniref:Uncharacterized protein n=1 Tax=Cajanus cajan TaxID=3821 RepID=A0A151U0I9_CAJCA|nr:uncharacterized protein LOC109817620 [Cajanus cajan]KYP72781.1 hypothetical protein KK1_005382 [Cajanus cajan]
MGTELLRPQDCLSQRIGLPPPFISRRRNYAANNAFSYRGARRKRVVDPKPSSDDSRLPRLLMEKVTILRRGESLDSNLKTQPLKKQGDALVVVGTQRLGPDPEMVPKQIRIADFKPVYAGSAFAVSPSPSALPLPSFFRKQAAVDDSATRDLRRLLRLE